MLVRCISVGATPWSVFWVCVVCGGVLWGLTRLVELLKRMWRLEYSQKCWSIASMVEENEPWHHTHSVHSHIRCSGTSVRATGNMAACSEADPLALEWIHNVTAFYRMASGYKMGTRLLLHLILSVKNWMDNKYGLFFISLGDLAAPVPNEKHHLAAEMVHFMKPRWHHYHRSYRRFCVWVCSTVWHKSQCHAKCLCYSRSLY